MSARKLVELDDANPVSKKQCLSSINNDSRMNYLNFQRRCSIEHDIITRVMYDNKATCHFDYRCQSNNKVILALTTYNPGHGQVFNLLITDPHDSDIKCLDQARIFLDQIRSGKNGYFSYRINWIEKKGANSGIQRTSYFYGSDINEVIDKFFEGKEREDFHIQRIEENPIS